MADSTLVFIDDGFLSKLSKFFGNGRHLKLYRKNFAEFISQKEGLNCEKIFVYTAPPFQSNPFQRAEVLRKKGYDKFVRSLVKEGIIVREGRCQRLKVDGIFIYKQKAVDILLAMDLMNIGVEFPDIKRIILVSSDSDFVPIIKTLKEKDIKVILYTYYNRKRDTNFSRCNELVKSVHKYVVMKREGLNKCLRYEK